VVLASGVWLAGCHPTGVETVSDLDTVATAHDSTFNFATPTTYALGDRVRVIGAPDAGTQDDIDPVLEQTILNTLENEMSALGYQKVNAGQNPDMLMTAAVLTVTNVTYYYGYWCTYWAYYYPCYPYYPPVVGVSVYTVGTLLVDLATPSAAPQQLNGVWTAVVRGVQSGTASQDQVRVVNGISQAFIQSPYLGRP
jgi:hypothetical protein